MIEQNHPARQYLSAAANTRSDTAIPCETYDHKHLWGTTSAELFHGVHIGKRQGEEPQVFVICYQYGIVGMINERKILTLAPSLSKLKLMYTYGLKEDIIVHKHSEYIAVLSLESAVLATSEGYMEFGDKEISRTRSSHFGFENTLIGRTHVPHFL